MKWAVDVVVVAVNKNNPISEPHCIKSECALTIWVVLDTNDQNGILLRYWF